MRSMKEINDIGVRALVDALGREDAQRFLTQFRSSEATGSTRAATSADASELPPLTIEEAHETIRDMQDPLNQQQRL